MNINFTPIIGWLKPIAGHGPRHALSFPDEFAQFLHQRGTVPQGSTVLRQCAGVEVVVDQGQVKDAFQVVQ